MTTAERLNRQRIRTERQRQYVAQRRANDPAWWPDYLARNAAYRRTRAANDTEYRHDRNLQAE